MTHVHDEVNFVGSDHVTFLMAKQLRRIVLNYKKNIFVQLKSDNPPSLLYLSLAKNIL